MNGLVVGLKVDDEVYIGNGTRIKLIKIEKAFGKEEGFYAKLLVDAPKEQKITRSNYKGLDQTNKTV